MTPRLRLISKVVKPGLLPGFLVLLALLAAVNQSFAQELTSLRGTVRSAKGELLAGVTVHIRETKAITQTGQNGEYQFNAVPVNVNITFSRLGFKDQSLELGLLPGHDNVQDLILITEIRSLDEINITEKFSGSNFRVVTARKFTAYPSTSGSLEGMLKNMPGVSANNELSSQYSARGGNFDENLLYLNDVEIFRPVLVSKGQQEGLGFVNPDMAGTVRFSAGGFEARYGDKLSSVLDVRYTEPDSLSLEAAAGILGSSATFKVPFKNSYLLAGARIKRNQDLLERQNLTGNYDSRFSDYQLLYRQGIGKKFSITAFGDYNEGHLKVIPGERDTEFGTSDEVLQLKVNYSGQEVSRFESVVGAITFAYNFSKDFTMKWINSATRIHERRSTDLLGWYAFDERDGGLGSGSGNEFLGRGSQYDFADSRLTSKIYNSEIRLYKQYRQSFLELGLKYQRDQIGDDIDEYRGIDTTGFTSPGTGPHWRYEDVIQGTTRTVIQRYSGFLQNTIRIGANVTLAAGLRGNYNTLTREFLLSPRASFIYFPATEDGFLFKISAGSYIQAPYYRELRNYDGRINPAARAQRSYQLLTGADYRFRGLGTELKLTSELYYKLLTRITPYRIEDLNLRYFADQKARGYAFGADFSLTGTFAKDLESTFKVSLMKTAEDIANDSYETSNSGGQTLTVYPGYLKRPTDQWINMGLLFQDRLLENPTYKVHLNLLFASALPTGPPGSARYRDVFSIPSYRRADIGFSKDFADPENRRAIPFVKKYFQSLSVHAEIFNLLNFKNTASYLWLTDVNMVEYAVPNYLTFRRFNLRISAQLRYK